MEKARILVVDDHDDVRGIIACYLQGSGYEVYEASDGKIALDLLMNQPPPTLIVSDIQMPNMNGFRLLISVRKNPSLAKIPVVLSSGEYYLADMATALGVAGFVSKPTDKATLLSTVCHVLQDLDESR